MDNNKNKCQSDPLLASKINHDSNDNNRKTKSVDNKQLQYSSRSSSLINPTSIPSTLFFNKKILKIKNEGLPIKKRNSGKKNSLINLSDQSSSSNVSDIYKNTILSKEQILAKQSWETKDNETLSYNSSSRRNHRTRSRSFDHGYMSEYYMAALTNFMINNTDNNSNTTDSHSIKKTNQEILKELNKNGFIKFRRNSVDDCIDKDITSPIFAKINGLTNLEFTDLYLDIVQRNLSLDELLQRINQIN